MSTPFQSTPPDLPHPPSPSHASQQPNEALPSVPHTISSRWPDDIPAPRFAAHVHRALAVGCRVALLGLPDDLGVRLNAGREGAHDGPSAFRSALSRYGVHKPLNIDYLHVFDAGDVLPARGNDASSLHETHRRVSEAAAAIVHLGLFPIAVGGGHDLTFAFVRGVAEGLGRLPPTTAPMRGLYLDAHLDVRDTPGSGMPMRSLVEHLGIDRLHLTGFNPLVNDRAHAEYFTSRGGLFAPSPLPVDAAGIQLPPDLAHHDTLFASLDLDAIDASAAPGVSALNPEGLSPHQACAWVRRVAALPGLRCFDIMELCPRHDEQGRTARLAAHCFLTFLAAFSAARGSLP